MMFSQFTLFSTFACLFALTAEAKIQSLESFWVPLSLGEAHPQPTTLWSDTTNTDFIGMVITNEELWTFRVNRNDLQRNENSMQNEKAEDLLLEQPVFYRESRVFQEELSKPLFEDAEWKQHRGPCRMAVIFSNSKYRGLSGALAQVMAKKLEVEVEWKEVAGGKPSDLILRRFHDGGISGFQLLRGAISSKVLFHGWAHTGESQWHTKVSHFKTAGWFRAPEEPDVLTHVQRVCDGKSDYLRYSLPYIKTKKLLPETSNWVTESGWEPSAELIPFEWPDGNESPGVVYCNDENDQPNDIMIIVTTVKSAWVLMLPEKLVVTMFDELELSIGRSKKFKENDYYRDHLLNKVLDLWDEVIRPDECTDDGDQTPALQGKFREIAVISQSQDRPRIIGQYLKNQKLIVAILEEMWRRSEEVDGPLRGRDPISIPYFSFSGDSRLGPDYNRRPFAERLLAPQHYFAVQSKAQHSLSGKGPRGKPGSDLQFFYGPQVVFSGTFAAESTWQGDEPVMNKDFHIQRPTGRGFNTFNFTPPPPKSDEMSDGPSDDESDSPSSDSMDTRE